MKPGGWIRFAPWVLAAVVAWLGASRPAVPHPERLRLAGVGVPPSAPIETVPADLRETVLPASAPAPGSGEGRIAGPEEPRESAGWRGASVPSAMPVYVPPPPNPARGRGEPDALADPTEGVTVQARDRGLVAPGTPTPWGWLAEDMRALDERAASVRQSDPTAARHPAAWMDWAMDSFDDDDDSRARAPAPRGAWSAPDRLDRDASRER